LMTSKKCRWLAISNTAIPDGPFADICMPDRDSPHGDWKIIPISAEESPNIVAGKDIYPGIVSVDWLKEKKRIWDKDDPLYRIFVRAEFVPTSRLEGEVDEEDGIDIGLDVARTGMDNTVWIARSGTRALAIKRMTGNDTMRTVTETQLFKQTLQNIFGMPVRFIKVDVIGIGAGVYDRLLELDEPVVSVNNAESAIDSDRYANCRAEMAWSFRQRCINYEVGLQFIFQEEPELSNLLRLDISAMKYKITPNGKIILWSKDDIKKEIGRSPDYWDALVMAYEDPKGGVPNFEFVSARKEKAEEIITEDQWQKLIGNVLDLEADFERNEASIDY
jgi:hypothetical protein